MCRKLCIRVYAKGAGKVDIAALAPLVLAEAQKGDASANAIVSAAFDELTTLVKVAFEKLKFEDDIKRLTVTGGLAHSGGFFKNGLYLAIRAQVAGVEIHEPILPPVLGAAWLALEMIDPRPSADFIPALVQGGQNIK